MAFEKISKSIDELNENIQAFAQSNVEYYKLEFFKVATKSVIAVAIGLVLAIFFILALILLSVAVAISISQALDSPSAGYFIVAGIYVLLMILFLIFGRKPLERFVLRKFSRSFFKK